MAQRSRVFAFILGVLLAVGFCAGCGQKQEATAPPPAPPANDTRYPADYVQQRTARERPMPMNTQTGK
jgi:energy-converting hydrogenase Eha subunit F